MEGITLNHNFNSEQVFGEEYNKIVRVLGESREILTVDYDWEGKSRETDTSSKLRYDPWII